MKVGRRAGSPAQTAKMRDDLAPLLDGNVAPPPCAATCVHGAGPHCAPTCPDVPRMLSSDPDKHPLEPKIAPLVYEMQRLDVFQPCWSCEGHNGPDGAVWKLPRVWFYADSLVHARALSDAVKAWKLGHQLKATWQVVLVSLEADNPDCSFSLEPLMDPELTLADLHGDVGVITAALHDVVVQAAEELARHAGT